VLIVLLLVVLLLGGGGAVVGLGFALGWFDGSGGTSNPVGSLGDLAGANPNVTFDNYMALPMESPFTEVEATYGKGKEIKVTDIPEDPVGAGFDGRGGTLRQVAVQFRSRAFYQWTNGESVLIVGVSKNKDGTDVVNFKALKFRRPINEAGTETDVGWAFEAMTP
jgi:hypothetical protein